MPSDATVIIAGLSSGGFALLGVAVNQAAGHRRDRTQYRNEVAVKIADLEQTMWNGTWVELRAHLEQLRARLAICGVRSDLVTALEDITILCWQDLRAHVGRIDGVAPGIRSSFVATRKQTHEAVYAELLREGRKRERLERSDDAIRAVSVMAPKLIQTESVACEERWLCVTREGVRRRR